MNRREFIARAIAGGFLTGAISTTGCGTLLYNERVHQPHSRDIDWKIVALDALGLIFFFVPGVVAFVVDFCTGAIYLPPQSCDLYYGPPIGSPRLAPVPGEELPAPPTETKNDGPNLGYAPPVPVRASPGTLSGFVPRRRLTLARSKLNQPAIEEAVSRQIGRDVVLAHASVRVSRLPTIDEFGDHLKRHATDRGFGLVAKQFFERVAAVTG